MTLEERLAAAAVKLVDKFGVEGVLVATAPQAIEYDSRGRPIVPEGQSQSPVERHTRAAVSSVERDSADGRTTYHTLAVMLVKPFAGEKLVLKSREYIVGAVNDLSVNGEEIAYEAEVS